MAIHSTAIVHPQAELADGVVVGPYSIIEAGVQVGEGTIIGPYSVLTGRTTIGKNNHFFSGAQVGILSQDLKHRAGLVGRTVIGDNNLLREFVTVSASTMESEDDQERATRIGNNCLLMACTHVGHDSTLGNGVIMANNAALSGHVTVHDHVTIGGLTGIHQFCRVGTQAFIGGMSRINMDVPPYMIVEGHPARCYGPNVVGLKRHGFDTDARTHIKMMFKILYRTGLNISQALEQIRRAVPACPEREYLLDFVKTSTRGVLK